MRACQDCEEQIPQARLKANPNATLCVECQEDAESDGRFTRHKMGHEITFRGDEIESMESYLVRGGEV